ncbi:replication factor C subunit 2 [Sugiyamaella lignohabitans]|uniref:Replication factor C subunit 2 n=1 Tax=Sugiyamaella lignohabitans TaxID=796027 RepID=A0A167FC67_9ASCO|nr:replication factor C subunit 2 [Sugiyamaella lignohabitans]ANB15103.1 replication factor C subunit 2 [Sugiyamaella lignohabitans]
MLFYGPPGTGKTSTILALAKELYGPELMKSRVLELNASDERGISIVREKVKNFAKTVVSTPTEYQRTHYPCPPYKIIILDEADSMTSDAQSALRRTMETYSKITRFCLICNYVTRIIDPLASRCSKFRFKPLDQSNALDRLEFIAKQENVKYELDALTRLMDASNGDLRKAITLLQSASRLNTLSSDKVGDSGLNEADFEDDDDDVQMTDATEVKANPASDKVTVSMVNEISGTVPEETVDGLVAACRSGTTFDKVFQSVQQSVEDIVLSGWSAGQLISQVHDKLLNDEYITSTQKSGISLVLSETDKNLNDGSDEHLALLSTMTRISKILVS